MSGSSPARHDDRVLGLTRAGIWVLLVLAGARRRRTFSTLPPALWVLATTLLVATIELARHWPWELTPLLGRAVAAGYALFGTMLVSCVVALLRPAEAIVPYATLAAWSLLLPALPVRYADDVSGAGVWIALMLALLALSVVALRVALPYRDDL